MPQLPSTRRNEHNYLSTSIKYRPPINCFAQIPILRLPLALILLFSSDRREPIVQIPNPARDFADVGAVVLDVAFGAADDNVEVELDVPGGGEPAGGVVGREADGVVACFMGGECEAAVVWPAGSDDRLVGRHFLEGGMRMRAYVGISYHESVEWIV